MSEKIVICNYSGICQDCKGCEHSQKHDHITQCDYPCMFISYDDKCKEIV